MPTDAMTEHGCALQAETLFGAAMELDPEHRTAFLEDACAGDSELLREIAELLAHHHPEGTDELFPRLFDVLPGPSLIGRRIGAYRVLREIGEGGMGTVYLVEREDVGQRAALKVVRDGRFAAPPQLRRFLLERRVLARLEHAHIARLFDAGVTDDGLPYLVMEYVEGTPITAFCDSGRLTVDERLRLFEQVCLAVQHAHRNLIVHRDLKPSNILVKRSSIGGEVKLLDFGVARMLDVDATDGVALTRLGALPLTPDYASPEQIRDEPITTASDVYSLGVILYELLSGHRPYRTRGCTPAQIERLVCETRPKPPSEAVLRSLETPRAEGRTERTIPESLAADRGTKPDRLRRRLAGDLDTIVLEALRQEPSRRYASVEHLMDDLRRHRTGLPVGARGDTTGYRLRKFVSRHRFAVAGTVAVAVLMSGFSFVTAVQSHRIRTQAERIAQERDRAEQVAGFLTNLFRTSNPYAGGGSLVSVRDVLDGGVRRIERDLAEQPQLRAEMMTVMAQAYDGLGDHAEARRLLESAFELLQALHGDGDPGVAGLLSQLGHVLLEEGDYAAAETLLRRSLAVRRTLYGADHPFVARSLNALAQAIREQERFAEAEPLLVEALAIDRRHDGEEGANLAQSLRGMAHLLRDRGAPALAEPMYREAWRLHRRQLGDEHPETANSLINIAVILRAQGSYTEAEELFRNGLAVKSRLLGDEHEDVIEDMLQFAALLRDMDDDAGADALYRRARAAEARTSHAAGTTAPPLPGGHR